MDVSQLYGNGDDDARDQQQADVYARAAVACAAQPRCTRFTVWGVDDSSSWLGADARALLFDDAFQPKPAWTAVDQILR
jgi:endo-1,4-beta-xylanase